MQPSTAQTYPLPDAADPNARPATIVRPSKVPLRVLVQNVGGALVFIGYEVTAVATGAGGATSRTYRLPAGGSESFIVSPDQAIYATGLGLGGLISVSISEALPIQK